MAEAVADPGPAGYSPEALRRFGEIATLLARLRRSAHEPLTDLVHRVVRELQLDVELDVAGLGTDNLALLHEAVAGYASADPHASLGGLMAYLSAERDHADGLDVSAPSEANSVKVLTVHKAKGLEYDEVFVPFLADGVFPSRKARSRWTTTARPCPPRCGAMATPCPTSRTSPPPAWRSTRRPRRARRTSRRSASPTSH